MAQVEFQRGNSWFRFAEATEADCDSGLFDPARHSSDPSSRLIDAHGRGSVSVFEFNGRAYALRLYYRGGAIRHLSKDQYLWRGLRRSRPWREFQLLSLMTGLQLPCPVPYACCVHKSGITSSGSLITELIPDTQTLAEYLRRQELPDERWFAIGQVIRRFHDHNIFHADLNAHNILIDKPGEVYLIDFDKGAQRSHARGWKFANLKRLQRSIRKCWMEADTFYFSPASWEDLKHGYLGESPKSLCQSA